MARDPWAVMDGSNRKVDAEDARVSIGALLAPGTSQVNVRAGLRPGPGNPGKVTQTATPSINVLVNAFQLVLNSTRGPGPYLETEPTQLTTPILDVPADPTNQRNDLIIFRQADTYYGDGSTVHGTIRVQGTPSGTPQDPDLSAYPDHVKLARVRVPANQTTITDALIDDLRPPWVVALGGVLPVVNQSERDALTAYDSRVIYRLDRKWVEIHDGTAWRVQGIATCTTTADRDSAVTHPTTGTHAYCSSTGLHYTHDGTVWVPDHVYAGRILAAAGVVHDEVAGTEVDITKLKIENYRVKSGWFYIFHVRLYTSGPDFGDDYFIRVRKDTALNGTVVADTPMFPASTNLDFGWYFALPWKATADDTDADFYLSIQRVAGTGTIDVVGDKKSAFWIEPQGGDSALWSEVT